VSSSGGDLGDIYFCWHLHHTSDHVLLVVGLILCVQLRMHEKLCEMAISVSFVPVHLVR